MRPARANAIDRFSDPVVLKKLLDAALRERDKARMTAQRHAQVVAEAVQLALTSLEIKPVARPPKDARSKKPEVAVPVLSDWQLAKITKTYNSRVCERRVERFAEKVISLTRIQRSDHPVETAHVWCLGDLIEGELIFPGQSYLIDSSLYKQVIVDGPRILVNFVRAMLSEFQRVHVTVVPGNHGRLGGRQSKDYHPDTNADRMLAGVAMQVLRGEPRVTWNLAEGMVEGGWYAIDDIGGYRTLLFHGDQIQGGLTTENHVKKLVLGWKSGGLEGGFDDAFLGHFHVIKRFTFNETAVRVAGSPESDNAYAVRSFGSKSRPSQHLQFVKPGWGITAEYDCWLDDVR